MSTPESIEDYYARILAATDDERRLTVAVEEMPGWDIFPFELDSLRIKPLEPLADEEPARRGETVEDCYCADPDPAYDDQIAWSNQRWALTIVAETRLPLALILRPFEHCDLPTVPDHLADEMGRLIVAISSALEELPSVGRAQLAKYGDGGAHLHLFFFGRPARMLQFRGSPLLDWEENLPPVPLEVIRANAEFVAERVVSRVGGDGPRWR